MSGLAGEAPHQLLLLQPNKRVVGVVSGHPGGRLLATTGNLPRFCFSSKVLFSLATAPGNRPFFPSHVNPTLCNTLLVVFVKSVKKVEWITCARDTGGSFDTLLLLIAESLG